MRYKQHTVQKLEAQIQRITTLQRMIEGSAISGPNALAQLEQIKKEIQLVVDRLDLESDE
jgi:hypothetical protein